MASYILLMNFTDQGIRKIKDTAKRADAFKDMAKKCGATVKDVFWTLGGGDRIRRREFITLIAGAAVAWPIAARAQQPAMPAVGFLNTLGQNDRPNLPAAFRRGLGETGYVDGRNVAIEYRFAENQHDRLPAL